MIANARLVALGVFLLFTSSGLLFETGVNSTLALTVAAVAIIGTGLAALSVVRTGAAVLVTRFS
ncbi:MAG: hypothetical protein ABEI27_05285 [Halobellus sp.]|uniref:hypothetical protein n=1 Tax=Halobellus sp. TaxID=1979212 RepID=UPI0035D4BFC6